FSDDHFLDDFTFKYLVFYFDADYVFHHLLLFVLYQLEFLYFDTDHNVSHDFHSFDDYYRVQHVQHEISQVRRG
ncbi:MAG: hypothetical protein LYZ70_07540, partial [Nitrososphaerales archaeon]|nr:hypothetical protein [Nitrososphaerales archaeon]